VEHTDANLRASIHNTTILLLLEDRPNSLCAFVGASEVDLEDNVPLGLGHSLERLVSEDTSIRNKNVDTTELFESNSDNLVTVLS
jgi:hypothetical protein